MDETAFSLRDLFQQVGADVAELFYDVSLQNTPADNHAANAIAGLGSFVGTRVQEILEEEKGSPLLPEENRLHTAFYLFGNVKNELTQSPRGSIFHALFESYAEKGIHIKHPMQAKELPSEEALLGVPRGYLPSNLYTPYHPTLLPLDMTLQLKDNIEAQIAFLLKELTEKGHLAQALPLPHTQIEVGLEGLAYLAKKAESLPGKNHIPPDCAQELALTMIYGAARLPPLVPQERPFLYVYGNGPLQ